MEMKINMFLLLLISLFLTAYAASDTDNQTAYCGELGDCVAQNIHCNNTTGVFYDDTIKDCAVNIKLLLKNLTARYDIQDKIRLEVLSVFQGVVISVILFACCASICVLAACIYCCRINCIDYRLKKDVEALTAKVKRDCKLKRPTVKIPTQPISESCNIVVEGAGVYVV